MKIFLVLFGLIVFSLTNSVAFAGGCEGDHAHSSESSSKKKQGSEI